MIEVNNNENRFCGTSSTSDLIEANEGLRSLKLKSQARDIYSALPRRRIQGSSDLTVGVIGHKFKQQQKSMPL